MHVQTHVLSGWCLGNFFKFQPRERFFCMLAACLPDLDGLGAVLGQEHYWDYHHVVGHNLCFGLLLAGVFTFFSFSRLKAFAVYLGLFHLHLLMDYVGSGPLWTIEYLWPFGDLSLMCDHAWHLYSWQNFVAFGLVLAWTIAIIYICRRTPLEYIMPSLDRKMVAFFRREKVKKQ